jgi:(1->4)-alpha-D-glucan 1-alpha-D-glucosylmutase
MNPPTATYRLQFRNGMDFDRAMELVPYLASLGISHLYASPIYQATTGSTHGYDVIDHNGFDPDLGGREGFDRLHDALKAAGIGLVLDIVPNHMAASLENPWWRDVLQWGEQSRFARHFDIDWSQKLTLPVLGQPFDEIAPAGELAPVLDKQAGTLALAYYDNRFPLHPGSWEMALSPFDDPLARELIEAADRSDPANPTMLNEHVREVLARHDDRALVNALKERANDLEYLRAVHAEQPWELTYWKEASKRLSYRRFFEVTGLVGVRVEDEQVFRDVHRLTLELVREGKVDGLRIDHVDGLADPTAYLTRLREAVGDDTYIIVEKILVGDELLPESWPIEGTSGYEFTDMMADVLPSREGLAELSKAYEQQTGSSDTITLRREAKRQILTHNFEGEVDRLTELLEDAIAAPANLREAVVALLAAMPVYRTYGAGKPMDDRDRAVLDAARAEASEMEPHLAETIAGVASFFKGDVQATNPEAARLACNRFEQLSGPAMAKGVEDTLFYRDHRFLALNEVGCDPAHPAGDLERFHRRMQERAARGDLSLSGTSTHDTKRGEDARARLHALSEAPEAWNLQVARWRNMNKGLVDIRHGNPAPEAEVEWMIYQAFAGVWAAPLNEDDVPKLWERFRAYLQKALREGKRHTSWTETNEDYESAVLGYAEKLLANADFRQDFEEVLKPFIKTGRNNSLTQTLLKLTAPGIPDIYQGAEGEDLSLVDPDNRRMPDFASLRTALEERPNSFAARKQNMIARLLQARRRQPDLFNHGDYQPLAIGGAMAAHLVGFTRSHGDHHLLVVAPRLTLQLTDSEGAFLPGIWREVEIALPAHFVSKRASNLLREDGTMEAELSTTLDPALLEPYPWLVLMI